MTFCTSCNQKLQNYKKFPPTSSTYLCRKSTEDIGVLGIHNEKSEHAYFTDHLSILSNLAKGQGISLPEDISSKDIPDFDHNIISSLLDNINDLTPSPESECIVKESIILLKSIVKAGSDISAHLNEQLIALLVKNNYPKANSEICSLLALGKHELTKQESADLSKLFIESSSTSVLELLSAKKAVSLELVAHIIKDFEASKVGQANYSLHKRHLLTGLQSIKDDNDILDPLFTSLVGLFKSSNDEDLITGLLKINTESAFFKSIFHGVSDNLMSIANLLTIKRLSDEYKSTHSTEEKEKLKYEIQDLLKQDHTTAITSYAEKLKDQLKIKSEDLAQRRALLLLAKQTQSELKKLLISGVKFDLVLTQHYESYFTEILESNYLKLDQNNYTGLLVLSMSACSLLLEQEHKLSNEFLKHLVSSLDETITRFGDKFLLTPNCINFLTTVISKLVYNKNIPQECVAKACFILERSLSIKPPITSSESLVIATNISLSFKDLAQRNIQKDTLTDEICLKYLNNEYAAVLEHIVSGLESIVTFTHRLPEATINIFSTFIQDTALDKALRIRAVELLDKVPDSIPEEVISSLSKFLVEDVDAADSDLETYRSFFAQKSKDSSQYESSTSSMDSSITSQKEVRNVVRKVDYVIAQRIAILFVKYAQVKGTLTSVSIDILEQCLQDKVLSEFCVEALSVVAEKNPALLRTELFDQLKEQNIKVKQQTLLDESLKNLESLLKEDSSKLDISAKEELGKLARVLANISDTQEYSEKVDLLSEALSKLLLNDSSLFNEVLAVVKLITPDNNNIKVVEQLLDFSEITFSDLCWFINHYYKSIKLYVLFEKYFNEHILEITQNPDDLGRSLSILQLIVLESCLDQQTVHSLIDVAKVKQNQAVNIVKILCLVDFVVIADHFESLEKLFEIENSQLTSVLCNLFAKNDQKLNTELAISALFKHLNSRIPLKILPNSTLVVEAETLLKLKSSDASVNKLSLLGNLERHDLQQETVGCLLQLVKDKTLSNTAIKIIANLKDKPILDEETSEIVCLLKAELKPEYEKLKPFLSIDSDSFLRNEEQAKISGILEQRFSGLTITISAVKKVRAFLAVTAYSQEFIDQVIFEKVLNKANFIEEFYAFLKFLGKYKLSETEVYGYLEQATLTKIIDIVESKVLSKSLEAIEDLELGSDFDKITYYCYLLKSNGWIAGSIAEILQKINIDNLKGIINSLRTICDYRITEEQRNKNGDSVLDILNKYSSNDLESKIYSIFSNQFEQKQENKGVELLKRITELNPELEGQTSVYLELLDKVHSIYSNPQEQVSISKWGSEQIKDWATKFKLSKHDDFSKQTPEGTKKVWPKKEEIAEVIAVSQRANNIHTAIDGKDGHLLRDTQILSLLLLLDTNLEKSGKLLQIATGEGKSATSAMLAAILALHGYKIDLVTSSPVLASAGFESAKRFFGLLGLTCGLNNEQGSSRNFKVCYDCDIVYGDALTFQADFLSNTSNQGAKRGRREFDVTIIDEVDSMLLDSSNHVAKQATPTPLMEYLLPIFTSAWYNFNAGILPANLEHEEEVKATTELIEHLINSMPIPKYLISYAKFQARNWAVSLIAAVKNWELDRDYVININSDGSKVINPVDNSTGVTQENMVWQNGLHQFLQIKHNCRISAETLTCFFITNISYFLKYDKILGMTGTLGSSASQEFLKTIYSVELSFIPTYKDKQLIELPGRLETTKEAHLDAVVESSYQEAAVHNRAVLIVCETIKEVQELVLRLEAHPSAGGKIKIVNYSRSEQKFYNREIEQIVHSNTIIVASNLAGRGTDIKTGSDVEENGGLHVISTFIAKNARDEAQVKGRTSRQGKCGSYQVIALDRSYYEQETFGATSDEVISAKRYLREGKESETVDQRIKHSIPKLLSKDSLYISFIKLYLELLDVHDDFRTKNSKINQLVADFGLWLKIAGESSSDISGFLQSAKAKFHSGTFTNPSYLVTQHYGINDGWSMLRILEDAKKIDEIYNFAAHYYTAKAWLIIGPDGDEDYKSKAVYALLETGNRVSDLISYLTVMSISAAKSGTTSDNELFTQVTAKIAFFKEFMHKIEGAIKVIQESGAKREVRVGAEIKIDALTLKNELTPNLKKLDLIEIGFLGINLIFDVEAYKPPKDWFDTIFAGCCAILQMVVGAIITIGSIGTAAKFGIGMFVEGVKDAYKVGVAISKGNPIKLDEYLSSKAISYAVIGAQVGFSKLAETAKAARAAKVIKAAEETGKISNAGINTITQAAKQQVIEKSVSETLLELGKTAGIQLAKTVAVESAVDWVGKEVRSNLLEDLEQSIKEDIFQSSKSALERNTILLEPNCNIERMQITKEINLAILRATKTSKNAQIINELASGVLKAASSHYSAGAALYGLHKVGCIADAVSKIKPIIEDIRRDIECIIDKAGSLARCRMCNASSSTSVTVDQKASISTDDNLVNNIVSMVSSMVMNFIQHKITKPIVSDVVSSSVECIVDASIKFTQQAVQKLSTSSSEYKVEHVSAGDDFYDRTNTTHKGKGKLKEREPDGPKEPTGGAGTGRAKPKPSPEFTQEDIDFLLGYKPPTFGSSSSSSQGLYKSREEVLYSSSSSSSSGSGALVRLSDKFNRNVVALSNTPDYLVEFEALRLGSGLLVSAVGETLDYGGKQLSHALSYVPGMEYLLQGVGKIFETIRVGEKKALKLVLSDNQYKTLASYYHNLDHGQRVVVDTLADSAGLGVALKTVSKVASPLVKVGKSHLGKASLLLEDAKLGISSDLAGYTHLDAAHASYGIVRGADGRITGVQGAQKHHILHQQLEKHPLWEKAGMSANDPINTMLLPTTESSGITTTQRTVHQGRHLDRIKTELEGKMDSALTQGKTVGWTSEEYRDALQKIIKKEYESLKSGERVLNKASDLRKLKEGK